MKIAASTYDVGQFVKLKNKTVGEILEVRIFQRALDRDERYLLQIGSKQESFYLNDIYCQCKVNEMAIK